MAIAATAIFGGTIVLKIVVRAKLVNAVDVDIIIKLHSCCANKFKSESTVLRQLKSHNALFVFGDTNEKGSPPENCAPDTSDAEPGVADCVERIELCGERLTLVRESWDC